MLISPNPNRGLNLDQNCVMTFHNRLIMTMDSVFYGLKDSGNGTPARIMSIIISGWWIR